MPLPKGFHWTTNARSARVTERRQNLPYRGTMFNKVLSPAEDERVAVDSILGPKVINFAYPFASTNAWIRGQPEVATTMISIIGADTNDLQPIGYYDATKAASAVRYSEVVAAVRQNPQQDIQRILPYRSLTAGDIDLGSNFSQVFTGLTDVFQARGGLSHLGMTSNGAVIDTSLFRVNGAHHRTSVDLNDEIRFGAVRRKTSKSTATDPALIRGTIPSLSGNPFAKEFSVVLNWNNALINQGRLLDHRSGIVVDNNGAMARAALTQNELRARYRWFSLLSETSAEIDVNGNWYFRTAEDGTTGGQVDVPTGGINVNVGQRFSVGAVSDIQLASSGGAFKASALAGFSIFTNAYGEINAEMGMEIKSNGAIQIKSLAPAGIQLGGSGIPQHPILIGNPAYLSTLNFWLALEAAFDGFLGAYGAAAAAAWTAIGPLTLLLDPTGSVASLCLSAAAAGTAVGTNGPLVSGAIASHLPTLAANPVGFLSMKTISE